MAFFDELKTSLKQKWLQFFQINRFWLTLQMEAESVYTPDGGKRPSSSLILGVVTALEPQLAELMLPFSQLNPDADALIDVLELNFAPDLLLGDRFNSQIMSGELSDDLIIEALTNLDPADLNQSFDQMTDEVVLVQTDDQSVMVMSPAEAAVLVDAYAGSVDEAIAFEEVTLIQTDDESVMALDLDEATALADQMPLEDMADEVVLVQIDDESVMALDLEEAAALAEAMAFDNETAQAMAETSPQEAMDFSVHQSDEDLMPSADEQTESDDVLSDAWVDEPSLTSEQLNNQKSSTQKQSADDEISRLFPNL